MVCGSIPVMAVRASRSDLALLQALRLPAFMGVDVGLAGATPPPAPFRWLPSRIREAPSKRRAGLAGRFCAGRALSRAGYAGPGRVKADKDGTSSWPEGWTGSIAYADVGAVAVASPIETDQWLGVDLSGQLSELQRHWLEPLLATRAELQALTSRSTATLSLLYSAKEALQRALQPRLGEVIDYRTMHCIGMDDTWLWFESTTALEPYWPQDRIIRVRYLSTCDWVLTVASSQQQGD